MREPTGLLGLRYLAMNKMMRARHEADPDSYASGEDQMMAAQGLSTVAQLLEAAEQRSLQLATKQGAAAKAAGSLAALISLGWLTGAFSPKDGEPHQ